MYFLKLAIEADGLDAAEPINRKKRTTSVSAWFGLGAGTTTKKSSDGNAAAAGNGPPPVATNANATSGVPRRSRGLEALFPGNKPAKSASGQGRLPGMNEVKDSAEDVRDEDIKFQ